MIKLSADKQALDNEVIKAALTDCARTFIRLGDKHVHPDYLEYLVKLQDCVTEALNTDEFKNLYHAAMNAAGCKPDKTKEEESDRMIAVQVIIGFSIATFAHHMVDRESSAEMTAATLQLMEALKNYNPKAN